MERISPIARKKISKLDIIYPQDCRKENGIISWGAPNVKGCIPLDPGSQDRPSQDALFAVRHQGDGSCTVLKEVHVSAMSRTLQSYAKEGCLEVTSSYLHSSENTFYYTEQQPHRSAKTRATRHIVAEVDVSCSLGVQLTLLFDNVDVNTHDSNYQAYICTMASCHCA